jgi:hypothetical protein
VPKETKVYIFLSNCDIIKKNNRIGIEGILIQNVHSEAATGKIVVIADYGILINGIGFQPVKNNAIIADCNILFGYDIKSVLNYSLKSAL